MGKPYVTNVTQYIYTKIFSHVYYNIRIRLKKCLETGSLLKFITYYGRYKKSENYLPFHCHPWYWKRYLKNMYCIANNGGNCKMRRIHLTIDSIQSETDMGWIGFHYSTYVETKVYYQLIKLVCSELKSGKHWYFLCPGYRESVK